MRRPQALISDLRVGRHGRSISREVLRELPRNPVREDVGKHQHVCVILIVGVDVAGPIPSQPAHCFLGRQIEMSLQHAYDRCPRPVGISLVQKVCDLLCIGGCLLLPRRQQCLIPGRRRFDDFCGE